MSFFSPLLGRSILISIGLMTASSATAELTLNVNLGYSMPSASDYQNSPYASASLGYPLGRWLGRAGFTRLGEFELEGGKEDTHLDARGPFLMVARTVKSPWLDWEVGLGAALLDSVATLQGYELKSEFSWEPLAEVAVHKSLSERWTVTGSYTYYHDVVGSNVSAIAMGIRRSF